MGVCGRPQAAVWVAVAVLAAVVGGANLPDTRVNDIEAFVKTLEYEAAHGGRGPGEYELDGIVKVDLNLLPDDVIVRDIDAGLEEEFTLVDEAQGENSTRTRNSSSRVSQSRQLSLIYQGVYAPDARFNAFVDGVMVNMVAEMKRKVMDPLYFRVYNRGIVEHVSATTSTSTATATATAAAVTATSRQGRQRGSAIGGGVIRGLTNVKRFGNAEVQVAGNTTLVRSHYVFGPLNLELIFNTERGVRAVNSTLGALAGHAVAQLNDSSSKMVDFIIDSPEPYEIRLTGTRSGRYQLLSHSALTRMFKPEGRLERRLRRAYVRARGRRIPDVAAGVTRGRKGRRNRNKNSRTRAAAAAAGAEEGTGEPELP